MNFSDRFFVAFVKYARLTFFLVFIQQIQRSSFTQQKSFPASCRDYILHVAGGEHNSVLVKYSNECDRLSRMTPNGPSVDEGNTQNTSKSAVSETPNGSNGLGAESVGNNTARSTPQPTSSNVQSDSDSDVSIRSVRKRTYSIESDESEETSTPNTKRHDNRPPDRSETRKTSLSMAIDELSSSYKGTNKRKLLNKK